LTICVKIKRLRLRLRLEIELNFYSINIYKMSYKDFTEMPVWKNAFSLMLKVYKETKKFPSSERFGFVSDMRRAAQSVTNNISEGFGRYGKLDKTRSYKISRASCYELINQTLGSQELNYINEKE